MHPENKPQFDNIKALSAQEVAELRQIAIMYHSRGKVEEAAQIFELLNKFRIDGSSNGA